MAIKKTQPAQGLAPRLGLFTATMVVMGSIIGSGVFKKVAPMSVKLQSAPLVLLAWLIAGVITLLGALTYAEVAERLAQTGGLYAYLRAMYGKWTSYFFGWACFSVIQSASIASIAYVFAEAVARVFPSAQVFLGVKAIAILAILFLTSLNIIGLLLGAWIENILTVLKIVGILAVSFLVFHYGKSVGANFPLTLGTLSAHGSIPLFFSAMLGAFWAFDGLNNIGFIGGEVREAQKNIPRALVIGVFAILGLYLLVNFIYLYAIPFPEVLLLAQKKDSIFAIELVQLLCGASAALFVSYLIVVSTFGATNGSILSSARIYYAMARDGIFFSSLGKTHPKLQTPALALVVQGIWSSALVLTGSFDELTDRLIFASFIFYGLGAVGLFVIRKKNIGSGKFLVPSWIPFVYALFCFTLVGITIYQEPVQAAWGLSLILLGLPVHWIQKRFA